MNLKNRTLGILSAAILVAVCCTNAVVQTGCKTHLDPAGVYGTNQFLFGADKVIVDAKADMTDFVSWEMENRATLASSGWGNVTKVADSFRVNAPLWFKTAVGARNVYSNALYTVQSAKAVNDASNALQSEISGLQTHQLEIKAVTNAVKLK